ncbi:MAG: DNA primase [Clostridiales bacterium]|nr:DNA primase [Clostridiales bacterium]
MSRSAYDDVIEQVKENCDIVDVIGKYVVLKRAGSNYKGLCPFHGEKTPSFIVSQEKQIFTCFGCGKTGDVIRFVQLIENIDFMDAVEKLASEAGIEIKKAPKKFDKKKDDMYELNRTAAIHFYKNLRNGANEGLKYVVSRGISPETAVKFGIGYAKDEWRDLVAHFKDKDISEELALEAGLFSKNKKNESYDKFRNRVIFPIKNTRDKVIGFGGRAIDDSMPKYLNSPETLVFKKKDNLYGLNLAKNEIRRQNLAIVVEGYMDVISLVEAGVENVVASLGTALTPEQAKLLKRYTDTVVLSYDSDGAGQAAAMRGIDILQEAGLKVKILVIDDGKDPDEFIRKNGKKAFEELTEKAVSFMEYKINSIKKKYDMNTTDGSIRFLEEISYELKKIKSPMEQAAYVKMVSEMTRIPESSIRREIEGGEREERGTVIKERMPAPEEEKLPKRESYKAPVVKTLIKLMIGNGGYIPVIAENPDISDYFYGSGYERILEQIVINYTDDGEVDINSVMDGLSEEDALLVKDIVQNVLPVSEENETLIQCAKKIKSQSLRRRYNEILKILEILDEDQDREQIEKLSEEIMNINSIMKEMNERKE